MTALAHIGLHLHQGNLAALAVALVITLLVLAWESWRLRRRPTTYDRALALHIHHATEGQHDARKP